MTQPAGPATADAFPVRALVPALAAWLVPGLGHVLLGRRLRGAAFAVLVLVTLGVGCALDGDLTPLTSPPVAAGGAPVARGPLVVLRAAGLVGLGAPYAVLAWGVRYEGNVTAPGYEYGSAFLLLAALMNWLLILDAWDIARGLKD